MLLKRRTPRIDSRSPETRRGFEHLDPAAIAVLRWLKANRIDFVVVGPVAAAMRGHNGGTGPVAIIPAPYRRNLERLARALEAGHACIRVDGGISGELEPTPAKLTADKLADGQVWALRCGSYELDVESQVPGGGGYQELLYEAGRFEPAEGVRIEVASPEDIEHYAHIRRTGTAPEIRIMRAAPA